MTARRRLAFVLYRASLWLLGRDPSCCVTVYSDRFAEFPRLARFVRDLEAMPFQPDDLGVLVCYQAETNTKLAEEMARDG